MFDPAVVAAALIEYAEEHLDWGSYGSYINYIDDISGKQYEVPELGIVTIVDYHNHDSYKNYDNWTEDLWIVFEIGDTLYRATGTYTSYEGENWNDELKIVRPMPKVITVFEDVE